MAYLPLSTILAENAVFRVSDFVHCVSCHYRSILLWKNNENGRGKDYALCYEKEN